MILFWSGPMIKKSLIPLFFLFLYLSFLFDDVHASGYKLPEQSGNSVALAGAYIANSRGPDTAYYNPANMAWEEDFSKFEINTYYLYLPKVDFKGTVGGMAGDTKSFSEHFFIPNIFCLFPEWQNFRLGLSLVSPFGLSKRWPDAPAKTSAGNFTLKVIELNPTVAYRINHRLAIGGGVRGIYSDAKVFSEGVTTAFGRPAIVRRQVRGDSIDIGYNLAAVYRYQDALKMGIIYRSEVEPTIEGNGVLSETFTATSYRGKTNVKIALPASLGFGIAFSIYKIAVEIVVDRTFWSSFSDLDFNYDTILSPTLKALFDVPLRKSWKDVNAYRLGVTHEFSDTELTLMAGFAYDENPVPKKTLGFELPDSDSIILSTGAKLNATKKLSLGFSYLYSHKLKRIVNDNDGGINGAFDASAQGLLISVGYSL
jgi:long-chain fatty acid transport protein